MSTIAETCDPVAPVTAGSGYPHGSNPERPRMPADYQAFIAALEGFIPVSRIISDALGTLAFGTDASFYRLIPRYVVTVETEQEVSRLLTSAQQHRVPVTFRAAGTSLSGQAVTDSVLVRLGYSWTGHSVLQNGELIRLQPGVIGADANRWLQPFGRKIGPDPASLNAAMVGGIAANNASGMCCGTAQNSYQTLASMRIVFADGTLLDTADDKSRSAFCESHPQLIETIHLLQAEVKQDKPLADKIRTAFSIKNTTGYGLNALLDFDDAVDVLQHLLIGSEGTLGFISEIVYHTVVEHAHKATALLLFPDIATTSEAVTTLAGTSVAAVELMDRTALRSIESTAGVPEFIATLDENAAALLVEVRDENAEQLAAQIAHIEVLLQPYAMLQPLSFSTDPQECASLWNIRKGLFPAVGAMREPGTTVIIEDVAFPVQHLAAAVGDLRTLFAQHGYQDAIIFGHALAGNLHFVFTQDFSPQAEVTRYADFMDAVSHLVVDKYNGSLKAEHGTGRNMAPYVELAWGQQAYQLMRKIKAAFDPCGILNPDVILSDNLNIHVENLKPLPTCDPLVDACMECGFCEPMCPSKRLTLTPRQRIVVQREISELQRTGSNPQRLAELSRDFEYKGIQTCAADGLCSIACPVGINTGDLTRKLRNERHQKYAGTARWIGNHFEGITVAARSTLSIASVAQGLLGTTVMKTLTAGMHKLSGGRIPLWSTAMPRAATRLPVDSDSRGDSNGDPVVYLPSCASRMMGPARRDEDQRSLTDVTLGLLEKAGYKPLLPTTIDSLCCGMMFESKGLFDTADAKLEDINRALLAISEQGRYPILCDTSPCAYRMRGKLDLRLKVYEPIEFASEYLLPRLNITPADGTVAVHVTCSSEKQGLNAQMISLAAKLSANVLVPEAVNCCGFAGDRGFTLPQLNASALQPLREQIPSSCSEGISTSRTCEVGLSHHGGISYHSLFYLLDRVSAPKKETVGMH